MTPKNRIPTHPGKILREDFMRPKGITQEALARKMGVPKESIYVLNAGLRGVTARTAILLARALGTTEMFWMNLQTHFDLAKAREKMKKESVREVPKRTSATSRPKKALNYHNS